jgi:hypothetical protein
MLGPVLKGARGISSAFGKARSSVGGAWAGSPGVTGKLDLAQSALSGMKVGDMVNNPMIGVPSAVLTGMFAKDVIIDPIANSMDPGGAWMPWNEAGPNTDPYQMALREAKIAHEQKQRALMQQLEIEEFQKKAMRASMRLAALDPHLYNEVMAGRSLPKDAVVFGGQPRQDLMEELSVAMAQGQFQETSAQDELMQSLGV